MRLAILTLDSPDLRVPIRKVGAGGLSTEIDRSVATEAPIALEFNGIGYAVLMASPDHLEDLAYGFAQSERLITRPDAILDIHTHCVETGLIVRVTLEDACMEKVVERVRHRVSESSCGLCGIENLEQAIRPLPRVRQKSLAGASEIFRALGLLRSAQPLNARTGSVHAAALCSSSGEILILREDVGRHNALDKLLGAMSRSALNWDGGFCLLSSRCSYELVEKAALADCPMLVTVSAPTSLAISRASEAQLALVVLARSDAILAVYNQEGIAAL